MTESLKVSTVLPAKPDAVYHAWLDSQVHSDFTGSRAEIDPSVSGAFTAWDGYISGTTLELHPFNTIVQSWRTTEFPPNHPDSHLIVTFEPVEGGTRLSLEHSGIPEGQAEDYRQGWEDYYFTPMKAFFEREAL